MSEVILTGVLGTERKIAELLKLRYEEVYPAFYNNAFQQLLIGKVTENEYLCNIVGDNSWPLSVENLKQIIRNNFQEIDNTKYIIQNLILNSHLKRGLLSDHAYEWIEYCRNNFTYETYFQEKIYSYEVGLTKQQPEIYTCMLQRLSLPASECLFIDDNAKNIALATKLGFKALLFTSAEELAETLTSYGLATE